MSMTDPLADMLTRIRNANKAYFDSVEMPLSKLKVNIAKVLEQEGYITGYSIIEYTPSQKSLKIELKYGKDRELIINGLRRISQCGCRRYSKSINIPKVMSGLGIGILSTSRGLMTDRAARKENIGGELLCEVW